MKEWILTKRKRGRPPIPDHIVKGWAEQRLRGVPMSVIAKKAKTYEATVLNKTNLYAEKHGLVFPVKRAASTFDWAKAKIMAERRLQRETLDSIGKDFGITRERVRQLTSRYANFHGIRFPRGIPIDSISTFRRCIGCQKSIPNRFTPRLFCSRACRSGYVDLKNKDRASKIISKRINGMVWIDIIEAGALPSAHRYCYREFRRRIMAGEKVTPAEVAAVFNWGVVYRTPLMKSLMDGSVPPLNPL